MHHANVFYGHAAVLARYCGVELAGGAPPPILGYLQHGWNTHDGFAVGHSFIPGVPKFVWSQAVARRGWALGRRDYVVIGSPWAYLLRVRGMDVRAAAESVERAGTIVYPFHGWEGQNVVGDHASYADEVRRTEGDVPLTACLYWNDYDDERIRAAYAARGFRVITHGHRGHNHIGVDHEFLDKQLTEQLRHRRTVSNRMGSALLYGASVGSEIGIYGDPMVLDADHAVLGGMARQIRLVPELHRPRVDPSVARKVANSELGVDVLLTPDALSATLGWTARAATFCSPGSAWHV